VTSQSPARRAVVVGGSIAGLLIGNMLVRRDWQVDVFERADGALASRGAGIAWHHEMGAIMLAAGAADETPIGIAMDGRRAYDRFGNEIAYYRYPQYLAAWGRIFDPLRAAFPTGRYHPGRELVRIGRAGRDVVAHFSDGSAINADLIVGADGFRSTVRSIVAPDALPRYGGYVGWRGLVEEARLSAPFRAEAFDKFAFCFPGKGQFIGYPVPGINHSIEVGRRRYNFLWYYPVAEGAELNGLLTDETGHLHDYSIPPPLIRRAHIDRLNRDAAALLPPRFAEAVAAADRAMLQPIYDVAPSTISFDRIVLIGDAASVARPHVGIGVLKAGQDALELASRLADCATIDQALARYQSARLPPGRAAVEFGRHLGAFIERGLPQPWSDRSLNLSPETIIRVSGRPIPGPMLSTTTTDIS
jgi:2-polyprenyl-6-methoxyphenol hydroxylase-like FAD-dependent oxidoreductase